MSDLDISASKYIHNVVLTSKTITVWLELIKQCTRSFGVFRVICFLLIKLHIRLTLAVVTGISDCNIGSRRRFFFLWFWLAIQYTHFINAGFLTHIILLTANHLFFTLFDSDFLYLSGEKKFLQEFCFSLLKRWNLNMTELNFPIQTCYQTDSSFASAWTFLFNDTTQYPLTFLTLRLIIIFGFDVQDHGR